MTIEHRVSDMLPSKLQEHFRLAQCFGFQNDNYAKGTRCNELLFRGLLVAKKGLM